MVRIYDATSMVALPVLTGARGLALTDALLAQARSERERLEDEGGEWPEFLERARLRLEAAAMGLEDALSPQPEGDSGKRQEADVALDHAWRNLENWAAGVLLQPDDVAPELPKLRALYDHLFANGLSFLALSFPEEYAESKVRLGFIHDEGYEAVVEALGGAWFLKALDEAHGRYGEVLELSSATSVPAEARVRDRLYEVRSQLRWWVVKVVAWRDPDEAGSDALSEALLRPLVEWENPRSSSSGT